VEFVADPGEVADLYPDAIAQQPTLVDPDLLVVPDVTHELLEAASAETHHEPLGTGFDARMSAHREPAATISTDQVKPKWSAMQLCAGPDFLP
jgi:hypothetical protein